MHLSNALAIAENFDAEWLHNIILDVIQMILVDAPVLSSHAFPQLEPNLPLEAYAIIPYQVCMSVISSGVRLGPSQDIIHG